MPNVALTSFYSFVEALAEKVHNLGSDTLKVALTNTAPNLTDTQLSSITQLSNGSGYSAGGYTVTTTSSAQTSGTYKLVLQDLAITANGGNLGPFRYLVVYNDTATNDELIGYYDYGTALTLVNSGNPLNVDWDASNGALTIGRA